MNPDKKREQILVVVSALYATGQGEKVESLLRSEFSFPGTDRRFFEELFIHLSLVLGFPTMIDGLENLSKVSSPESRPRRKINPGTGHLLLRRVYGNRTKKLLANLRSIHPELPAWVVRDVYGKVFSRKGLTLRERELCNVIVLSFQNLEKQLRSHVRGAQRAGMQVSDLRRALRLAMKMTGRKKLRAIEFLRPVVSQKKKT
ncbi:MAG: carboxymuconolactone decarboxylase family protein [Bacteroidota bacterium]